MAQAIGFVERTRQWARGIKRDAVAVYFAARDPRTPLAVRLLALAVAAYALSPIDLVPDFIPVLGHLDDVIIVPAGLWLVMRFLPPDVVADARARASALLRRPTSFAAGVCVALIWLLALAAALYGLLTTT